MNLQSLLDLLRPHGQVVSAPSADPVIGGLAVDSREVTPGAVFFAYPGVSTDGHDFIAQAVARGAGAVVAERPVSTTVPVVLVKDARTVAELAAIAWYHEPMRHLRIVGVTGTNGKTTTTAMVRHLLSTGQDAGSIGTIGAYDGVHLGHRAVIGDVRRRAAAGGHASAVVTFDRHPAQVIRPESAPLLLTDLDQKLELLAATGVDHTLVVGFDRERAAESAEDFVRTVLVDCLNVRQVVVGEDFHFGHRRAGNVALLEELGGPLGFGVHGHELVGADGRAARDETQVSSTAIRRALVEGRLAFTERRPPAFRGT